MKMTNIGKFDDDDELQERGFDKLPLKRGFAKFPERGFDKLPEELKAAAVLKCSPHFLVTANEEFRLKYF